MFVCISTVKSLAWYALPESLEKYCSSAVEGFSPMAVFFFSTFPGKREE